MKKSITLPSKLQLLCTLFLLIGSIPIFAQTTYHVKTTGDDTKDGKSWLNAFATLQKAIDVAVSDDEIWIAEGSYFPAKDEFGNPNPTNNQFKTFYFAKNVKVYGGFKDGDTFVQRDWENNHTILSGNLGDPNNIFDNATTVVYTHNVSPDFVMDGVIIEEGAAFVSFSLYHVSGGGWYDDGSNGGSSSPTIRNCIFRNNQSQQDGGAMYNNGAGGNSSPILENCSFYNNHAYFSGGAVYNFAHSGTCFPLFSNCNFENNIAEDDGGIMYNHGSGFGNSSPVLTNCLFTGNFGGGIYCTGFLVLSTPVITNCTFYQNQYYAIETKSNSAPIIRNSIFWNDSLSFGSNGFGSYPQISYTLVPNGSCPIRANCGVGMIFAQDPLFNDPANGDFSLQPCSPVLDLGDNSFNNEPKDLAGNDRIINSWLSPTIDMGAYEYQSTVNYCTDCLTSGNIVYVNANTSGQNTGKSWADALTNLQRAITIAKQCSNVTEIWVAEGTYIPTQEADGNISSQRDFTFFFDYDIKIFGGFPNTGNPSMAERNWKTHITTLSGDFNGDDGPNFTNSEENAYSVVHTKNVSPAFRMDGFFIKSGIADADSGASSEPSKSGGGWYNDGSTGSSKPTIFNCQFSYNQAVESGGGMFNYGAGGESSPSLIYCDFFMNDAYSGGAINNNGTAGGICNPIIKNSLFLSNTAAIFGGAINNNGSGGTANPSMINCAFINNHSDFHGGAINAVGNSGICLPNFTNCTFSGNTDLDAGAIVIAHATATLTNCIMWDNSGEILPVSGGAANVTYSIIEGGFSGLGNLNENPLFNDPSNNDYSLQICSPALDVGSDAANSEMYDLGGNDRQHDAVPTGQTIDMGAYEYQITIVPTASCQSVIKSLDASGNTITVNANELDNSSDGCSLSFLINNMASLDFDCNHVGSNSVTLKVTDIYGQESACNTTIIIQDNIKPILTNCPTNISKAMDAGVCGAIATWTAPTATDNCDPNPAVAQTLGDPSGTLFPEGTHTINYKATDNSSNESLVCSFTITVDGDIEKPILTNCPTNISKAMDAGVCGAIATWTTPTATDNCAPNPTVAQTLGDPSGTLFSEGTHTINYKATDNSSNESLICSFTITVDGDMEKPILTNCPTNISKAMDAGVCGAVVTWTTPTATDNCAPNPTVAQTLGDPSGTLFSEGTHTINYKATDNSSNESLICSFTITVDGDMEKPILTNCPTNISKAMDAGVCGAVVTWTAPTATDNCDPNPTVAQTLGDPSGTLFPEGTHTINYKATDNSSNESLICSFTITVDGDMEKPILTNCPTNISKAMDTGICGTIVTWSAPTATDNCDPNPAVAQTLGDPSGSLFSGGTHTINYKATDNSSNESLICSFTITVDGDMEKPILTNCPTNISKAMDAGVCGAIVTWTTPTATDNCDPNPTVAQTLGDPSGTLFPEGTHTINYKATDNSSNESDCAFIITVLGDTEKPNAQCQNKTIQLDANGNASITTADIDNNSSDACGIKSLSLNKTDFNCSNIGDSTVTLTVTDNNNNTATCTATVTVESLATLSIIDVSKIEGSASGHTIYLFQVNRSMPGCAVEVDYATADGTATTANNDYIEKSGSITFSATGSNTKTIAIQVNQDTEVEPNESFFVNLSNSSAGATIADGQGEAIILNDDSATISIDDVAVNENADIATFTVNLNTSLSNGFSADYSTSDITAQDENGDNDYASANGTLNFAGNAGESQTLSITINNDDKVELDETFKVQLSNLQTGGLNVSIADGEGIGTILNDDSATLSIDDVSKLEGLYGTTDYIFTISLSGNVDTGFSTDWETQDGTAAAANNDYASANGNLNFTGNDGESHTLTVQANGDCAVEPNEDFFVKLLNLQADGRNISFAKAEGLATITNDDAGLQLNSCPGFFSVPAGLDCAYKLLDYRGLAYATGGCGAITKTQCPAPGTTVGAGITTIDITATDAAGNSIVCSFDIEVADNLPPTAICQNTNIWIGLGNTVNIAPYQIDGGSTDNCGIVNLISATPNTFDCSNLGANIVTLTVEDGVGLQTTCTATVTVNSIAVMCYLDADGDSYGDASQSQQFCFACGMGYVDNDEDCNDSNASIYPNATEVCDNVDNNCDGNIDEGFDQDGDGFTTCQGDCDDNDTTAFPGNTEICGDNIDNNCDGQIDEGCNPDNDGDGFSVAQGDCNDNDITIFPGAPEICDGVDNNCDGQIDEGFDLDFDGYTICNGDCDDGNAAIHPGATEACDGMDNNCDGQIDEGLSGETFVGNIIFSTQAQIDDFPSCFSTVDGDIIITGMGIIDLTALSNLTNITGDLLIQQTSLTSLTGLENLTSVGSGFILVFNSSLTDCCPVETLISSGVTGLVYIAGNSTGCENQPVIVAVCGVAPLITNPSSGNGIIATQVELAPIEALVFPNPANDKLNIYIKGNFENGLIQLLDMQGRALFEQKAYYQNQFNVSELDGGIYLIKWILDGSLRTRKVVIE